MVGVGYCLTNVSCVSRFGRYYVEKLILSLSLSTRFANALRRSTLSALCRRRPIRAIRTSTWARSVRKTRDET